MLRRPIANGLLTPGEPAELGDLRAQCRHAVDQDMDAAAEAELAGKASKEDKQLDRLAADIERVERQLAVLERAYTKAQAILGKATGAMTLSLRRAREAQVPAALVVLVAVLPVVLVAFLPTPPSSEPPKN